RDLDHVREHQQPEGDESRAVIPASRTRWWPFSKNDDSPPHHEIENQDHGEYYEESRHHPVVHRHQEERHYPQRRSDTEPAADSGDGSSPGSYDDDPRCRTVG